MVHCPALDSQLDSPISELSSIRSPLSERCGDRLLHAVTNDGDGDLIARRVGLEERLVAAEILHGLAIESHHHIARLDPRRLGR